ncbi:MAG: ATP-dependent DNA helicase RecG, partial [Desulfitobacteriaceae bacterium]|nr:ATP-dependent DNA helicase RecG [Desulfitobacteriaceae bacterium]
KVDLLTGRTSAKERARILAEVRDGKTGVLVGTHALIQDRLLFKELSLAVTDEQHRFGVMQRAALQSKGASPDVLVMTATPIPRTLALTLYGDLNLSLIDEMPPGRKEIKTYAVKYSLEKRVFAFIEKELRQGRQAYVVCPLVEESEKIDLQAATELAELLSQRFSKFTIALLHGKMKPDEKEKVMAGFRCGEIHLLVSTTVIEVGINIPNATVMLVRDAERFGLAQLHQLRGRIGRGGFQSYCILMHNAKTKEARERMSIMESTNDGFKIAEADLSLRGPGDFFGTRQHGLPELKVASIFDDAALLESARQEALAILDEDPKLTLAVHREMGWLMKERFKIIN